jgi:tetratricopeptide (TPR) repeat protein
VIAIANLDQQIAQASGGAGLEEFLLMRSRFLGDYESLDRASRIAEGRRISAADLLQRARTRSAVHRFADALDDVTAAERAGASVEEAAGLRASILIATGRAGEVIRRLEHNVAWHPSFASRSALAVGYAAVGRFEDADRQYANAIADLDTTLPFPYAWIYFARGVMWTEQAGDSTRGAAMYTQALAHLPEFAAANIHLAEIEAARGELGFAIARVTRVVRASNEPEALALLGVLHVRTGDADRGRCEISLAKRRFESLLARHPLAFADHAAEFYLGAGHDPQRAWGLAQQNLANRATPRALALAIKAARAAAESRFPIPESRFPTRPSALEPPARDRARSPRPLASCTSESCR